MAKKTKIVLLDFNGVTANAHYLRDKLNAGIEHLQTEYPEIDAFKTLEKHPPEKIYHVSLKPFFKELTVKIPSKNGHDNLWEELKQDVFAPMPIENIDWIEDTYRLIKELKSNPDINAKIGLASNQKQDVLEEDLRILMSKKPDDNLEDLFDAIVGISDGMGRKERKDPIIAAIKKIKPNATPADTDVILVGDNTSDLLTKYAVSEDFPNYKVALINHKDMGNIQQELKDDDPDKKNFEIAKMMQKNSNDPIKLDSFSLHETRETLRQAVISFVSSSQDIGFSRQTGMP